MDYITQHFGEIIGIVTIVISLASAIANLTPTQTDNKVVAVISKIINFAALNLKK